MSPAPDRLLSIQEVVAMVGLSRATIYDMVKRNTFPPQYRAGLRAARWRMSDVQKWIDGLTTATESNWR